MKALDISVSVLLIIGAINWGLVGLFGFNLIGTVFGDATAVTRVIYSIVGLCGLYEAYNVTLGFENMHHRWCEMPSMGKH